MNLTENANNSDEVKSAVDQVRELDGYGIAQLQSWLMQELRNYHASLSSSSSSLFITSPAILPLPSEEQLDMV